MFTEHTIIVLNSDHPAESLFAGDVGTVVHAYTKGRAYEVEFVQGNGSTVALLTLPADEVRSLAAGELLHTRRL